MNRFSQFSDYLIYQGQIKLPYPLAKLPLTFLPIAGCFPSIPDLAYYRISCIKGKIKVLPQKKNMGWAEASYSKSWCANITANF